MAYLPISVGQIIGVCPKSASTSLINQHHYPNLENLSNVAVIELKKSRWKVTGILRDPLDRFESAYNFFKYGQCGGFPSGKKYENISHFVASVLNGDKDEHWLPQTEMLILCDDFVDLETYPLERKENAHKHIEVLSAKDSAMLKEYYSADFAQRGNAWGS